MSSGYKYPKAYTAVPLYPQLGVDSDSHVVVYDNNMKYGLFTAPRVWWMFRVSEISFHLAFDN